MTSILHRLPELRIRIAQDELAAGALAALRALRVRQRSSRPALCELVFAGLDPAQATKLRPGAALRIEVGGALGALFDGEIAAAERRFTPGGVQELRLRAHDLLDRLRRRQPVRVHDAADALELARSLLADDGITVEACGDGGARRRRVQFRQTDHDLLEDACAEAGLGFAVEDRSLLLYGAAGSGRTRSLRLGDTLHELTLVHSAEPACDGVIAAGSDAATARHHRSLVTAGPPGAGVEGAGAGTTWTLAGEWLVDEVDAQARARAERDHRAGLAVVVTALVDGDPALRPGVRVAIDGVPGEPRVTAVLHQIIHRIDADAGWVCEVDSRPPERPARKWSAIVAMAKVVDVDDPDGHGRVRVRLPAFEDLELGWLASVVPAGGDGKGLCALAELDDDVVVVFPREDLSQGFVLGGVHGEGRLPEPLAATPRPPGFALRTARGQTVHFDDDGDRLRIAVAGGSFIELSPEALVLETASDLRIRAPGGQIVIAAQRIDFEQA